MKSVKLTILFTILLYSITPVNAQNTSRYYERGVGLKEMGKIPMALFAWVNGRNILAKEGKSDPRIAIAFIETATQYKKENYYPLAVKMYLESITRENFEKYPDTIIEEAERILPLLMEYNKKDLVNEWKDLIENRDPALAIKIKGYWVEADRTPFTEKNERLIEHWERIAYSRENFTRKTNTVYGTDDRGIYWVKFGKPSIIESSFENKAIGNPITTGSGFRNRPVGGFGKGFQGDIRGSMEALEFEVWVYKNLYPGQQESVVHIFGEAPGAGNGAFSFKHVESFEDFVPTNKIGGGSPFAGEQGLYFRLAHLDPWFYDRFVEASDPYVRSTSIKMWDHNDLAKYDAPLEKSEMDDKIRPVNIITTQTRILDDNNNPKMSILAISSPVNIFSEYSVQHTLKIHDADYNETEQIEQYPDVHMDNLSFITFDHVDSTTKYLIVSRAFEEPVDSVETIHIGRASLKEKTPLDPNPEKLELSDLITGIEIPEQINKDQFPYPILPAENIYAGEPLKVYLEIYHLFMSTEGKAKYEITYQIDKWRPEGWLYDVPEYRKQQDRVSRTAVYESMTRTAREAIEFDVTSLKEGRYVFTIGIIDMISGQTKSRSGDFEIRKLEEKK
ncbi:MAG: GWxTD domain-containing protein [bacterium]|nr:GWxTD domain-containing protein [bacterium]